MKYCKKCVVPDTRPAVTIEKDGVCNCCKIADKKHKTIDWAEREKKLRAILDQYRGKNGNNYDCLIPVSGGKDSTWQFLTIKEKYGMHPLLYSFAPCMQTETGEKNFRNIINLGADLFNLIPNPKIYKKLMLEALRSTGEPCLFCHFGVFAGAVRTAINFRIPLIIWGEGGMEYGLNESYDSGNLNYINMGKRAEDFVSKDITLSDLNPYIYPSKDEIKKAGLKQLCLGDYIRYNGKGQVEMIKKRGFSVHNGPWLGTYVDYENLDCSFGGVHDYLGYLKFGYGRATSHATQDIRNGALTREEAIRLVKEYDGKYDTPLAKKYYGKFLEFLSISDNEFNAIAEKFRNKDIWEKRDGKWIKKYELK